MLHYPAGSSLQKMGTLRSSRDVHGPQQYSGRLQSLARVTKCDKKISLTTLHRKPEIFIQGRMDHGFTPNSDPTI